MKKLLMLTLFASLALCTISATASPPIEKTLKREQMIILVCDATSISNIVTDAAFNHVFAQAEMVIVAPYNDEAVQAKITETDYPVFKLTYVPRLTGEVTELKLPDQRSSFERPLNTKITTYKGFAHKPPLRIRSSI